MAGRALGDPMKAGLKLRDIDMKNRKSKKVANLRDKPGERRKRKPTSGSERRRVAKKAPASNVPTAPTYKIHHIAVDEIEVSGKRRQYHPKKAEALKDSIARIGLRTPLTIRSFTSGKKQLITGGYRLEAVKALGWKKVPCVYITGGAKVARLWEISENLHRAELTALEESELIAEWLKLTEQEEENVSAQNGQKGKVGRPKGGVSEAARKLPGKGTQSAKRHKIERAAKRAAIHKDVKQKIVEAGLADSPTKLDAIASKPDKEAQLKELERVQAGHRESGGDGAENLPSAGPTLFAVMKQQWFTEKKLRRTHWERAGHKDRTRFINDVLKYPLGAGAKNGARHHENDKWHE
jgi:ParB-like chromosome segregation protein Spo0J